MLAFSKKGWKIVAEFGLGGTHAQTPDVRKSNSHIVYYPWKPSVATILKNGASAFKVGPYQL